MRQLTPLLALLLVACSPAAPEADPLLKPDRNYHRWQAFDVLPMLHILTPPHDDLSPWDGRCSYVARVWGLDVGVPRMPRVEPTDTVQIDLYVTTRCPGPRSEYDEMTIYFDTRDTGFAMPLSGWISYGRPGDVPDSLRMILDRSVAGFVPAPFGECLSSPAGYVTSRTPGIDLVPPLVPCRKTGHPDTIEVRITIDPPLFRGTYCGPRPWAITVELLDIDQMVTYTEPVLFTFCSR